MSGMTQGAATGPRDRIVFAIILIVVGVLGLISEVWKPSADMGGWIVAIIGLGFLGAYAYTRQYGYLIPGGIMTGLGAGIVASETMTFTTDEATGGIIVLGLGLGFLAIWVIGALVHATPNHWWPVVPGGILAVVGGALIIGGQAVDLLDYWGIAVIAAGVLVLWRAWTEARAH